MISFLKTINSKFSRLLRSHKKWDPWSEEVSLMVERELALMDSHDPRYSQLYAQYVTNQFRPITVIRTNKDYEKVVLNLGARIQSNIDNPPEQPEYPQVFRNIRTLKELFEAKDKGITQVRGSTAYNGCDACKEAISGKIYLVDDLIKEYQKPAGSRSLPTVIPHLGCTTDYYDESERHGYCRCSWTEIPPNISNPDPGIDPEFIDCLDKLIEEDRQKYR